MHGGMDPTEVARHRTRLPFLHPEVYHLPPALLSQAKRSQEPGTVTQQLCSLSSTWTVPERLVLARVGKSLSMHLDIANRSNRLPKTSSWRLC